MLIGDPLVARVIKAMPGKNVRGYPVQVRFQVENRDSELKNADLLVSGR
jgi:hypothetical protein